MDTNLTSFVGRSQIREKNKMLDSAASQPVSRNKQALWLRIKSTIRSAFVSYDDRSDSDEVLLTRIQAKNQNRFSAQASGYLLDSKQDEPDILVRTGSQSLAITTGKHVMQAWRNPRLVDD